MYCTPQTTKAKIPLAQLLHASPNSVPKPRVNLISSSISKGADTDDDNSLSLSRAKNRTAVTIRFGQDQPSLIKTQFGKKRSAKTNAKQKLSKIANHSSKQWSLLLPELQDFNSRSNKINQNDFKFKRDPLRQLGQKDNILGKAPVIRSQTIMEGSQQLIGQRILSMQVCGRGDGNLQQTEQQWQLGSTHELMDHKFAQLLENNLDRKDISLQIDSRFSRKDANTQNGLISMQKGLISISMGSPYGKYQQRSVDFQEQTLKNEQIQLLQPDISHEQIKSHPEIKIFKQRKLQQSPNRLSQKILLDETQFLREKLLSEQNFYLRQQLMSFAEKMELERKRNCQYRGKIKRQRREVIGLRKQMEEISTARHVLEKQFLLKEELYFGMNTRSHQQVTTILMLTSQNDQLTLRITQLQAHLILTEEALAEQTAQKEELQKFLQQRNRQCIAFTQEIIQKDNQITELNQIIEQIKQKYLSLEQQYSHQHLQEQENQSLVCDYSQEPQLQQPTFSRSNSICLSLAQAQTLKNHIQEKEQLHQQQEQQMKQQMNQLISQHSIEKAQYLQKIDELNLQIEEFGQKIQELNLKVQEMTEINNKLTQEKLLSSAQGINQDNRQINQSTKQKEQRQRASVQCGMFYLKKLAAMQSSLVQEKTQKMRLLQHITYLQRQLCLPMIQQEDDMEELLEKCLDQLQRERQVNLSLRVENNKLRRHATYPTSNN